MKNILIISVFFLFCFAANAQYNNNIIIEPILKTDTTSIGQKIDFPDYKEDEVTISKITIPPDFSTGWQKHYFPVFAYVLEGTLTVELENNKIIQYPKNTSFSEVINTFHNGVNRGKENLILIAIYIGEKGKPLSEKKE